MADQGAQGTSRVVLLARAGKAADNLAEAVRQAGAELLLCVDPANTDEAALRALVPQALLVALEPSIEPALDRLDALLVDPGLSVIFDEADVAARRTGWEAARWARHLSAKLRRDDNVLPPGTENDADWQPSPGQVPKPAAAYDDVDLTLFTQEAVASAASVPVDGDPQPMAVARSASEVPHLDASQAHAWDAPQTLHATSFDVSVDPPAPGSDSASSPQIESAPVEPFSMDAFSIEALSIAPPAAPQVVPPPLPPLPVSEETSPGLLDDVMRELAAIQQSAAQPTAAMPPPLPDASMPHEAMSLESMSLEPMALEPAAHAPIAFEAPAHDALSFDAAAFDAVAFDAPATDAGEGPLHDLHIEHLSLDDVPEPQALPRGADSGAIAPMQFDDDAFFLQELSSSSAETTSQPLAFEGGIDLDGLQLDDMHIEGAHFDETPERPSSFVPRDPEPVMSLEDLIASSLEKSDDVPAGSAPTIPAAPAASPPPLPHADDVPAPAKPSFSFGELSLASEEDAAPSTPATVAKSGHDLSALEARISSLSLMGMEEEEKPGTLFGLELPGVVLIEAGLGGPDPARQLLSAIPAEFPAIVLVRLHLQGGRYDRLVAQMERASALPVALAESGATANIGGIYFLPEGIGVVSNGAKLRFIAEEGDSRTIFAALPSNNSAVVFLSGSDPKLVDVAMAVAATGTLVASQTPEDCYDGIACTELRLRGAVSGLPAELAGQLAARWPSH